MIPMRRGVTGIALVLVAVATAGCLGSPAGPGTEAAPDPSPQTTGPPGDAVEPDGEEAEAGPAKAGAGYERRPLLIGYFGCVVDASYVGHARYCGPSTGSVPGPLPEYPEPGGRSFGIVAEGEARNVTLAAEWSCAVSLPDCAMVFVLETPSGSFQAGGVGRAELQLAGPIEGGSWRLHLMAPEPSLAVLRSGSVDVDGDIRTA